ncbi:MAG: stage III sporulation protein AB [Clostridia bacterium]|nr:stage III sporulation protein AB [Clostridia bacterium]
MIIKVIGISILIYVCIKLSRDKKKKLKNTCEYIEGIIYGLEHLKTEIMFFSALLGKALINSSEFAGNARNLFVSSGNLLIKNPSLKLGDIFFENSECTDYELLTILKDLGAQLGTSDTENEIAVIDSYIEKISSVFEKCKNDYENKGKLIEKVGIITGILIAILVL